MACAQRLADHSPRLAGAPVAPLRRARPPPPLLGKAANDAAHCQASSAEDGRPQPGVRIQRPRRSAAAASRPPLPAPPSLSNPQAETRGASPPSRRPPTPLRPAAARPTAAASPSPRVSPPHEAVVACQPPGRPRVAAADPQCRRPPPLRCWVSASLTSPTKNKNTAPGRAHESGARPRYATVLPSSAPSRSRTLEARQEQGGRSARVGHPPSAGGTPLGGAVGQPPDRHTNRRLSSQATAGGRGSALACRVSHTSSRGWQPGLYAREKNKIDPPRRRRRHPNQGRPRAPARAAKAGRPTGTANHVTQPGCPSTAVAGRLPPTPPPRAGVVDHPPPPHNERHPACRSRRSGGNGGD